MVKNNQTVHPQQRGSFPTAGIEYMHSAKPEAAIVILMSPLFRACQLFGVLPLSYDARDPENPIFVRRFSLNFVRSVLVLVITTAYCGFHLFALANSILQGRNLMEVLGQSLWLHAAVVPYLVMFRLLVQPEALINLYTKDWHSVELQCGKVFTSLELRRFTRNCFIFYTALALVSAGFVAYHAVRVPEYPAYILHFLRETSGQELQFTHLELGIHAACQGLFMLWKWAGLALLELSLCIYGYTIVVTMQTLLAQKCIKDMDEVYSSVPDPVMLDQPYGTPGHIKHARDSASTSHADTVAMLKLLQNFQKVAQLLNDINGAFGPLLLIDFGQLIFMICALVFLPIKYYQAFDLESTILFGVNAVVFIARLVLLVICMGDVYPAGVDVNLKIAKILLSQNLEPALLNPILGHLSVFSANPICFNAWGFFPITRGTLLATLSVISTYIVVLLQVK